MADKISTEIIMETKKQTKENGKRSRFLDFMNDPYYRQTFGQGNLRPETAVEEMQPEAGVSETAQTGDARTLVNIENGKRSRFLDFMNDPYYRQTFGQGNLRPETAVVAGTVDEQPPIVDEDSAAATVAVDEASVAAVDAIDGQSPDVDNDSGVEIASPKIYCDDMPVDEGNKNDFADTYISGDALWEKWKDSVFAEYVLSHKAEGNNLHMYCDGEKKEEVIWHNDNKTNKQKIEAKKPLSMAQAIIAVAIGEEQWGGIKLVNEASPRDKALIYVAAFTHNARVMEKKAEELHSIKGTLGEEFVESMFNSAQSPVKFYDANSPTGLYAPTQERFDFGDGVMRTAEEYAEQERDRIIENARTKLWLLSSDASALSEKWGSLADDEKTETPADIKRFIDSNSATVEEIARDVPEDNGSPAVTKAGGSGSKPRNYSVLKNLSPKGIISGISQFARETISKIDIPDSVKVRAMNLSNRLNLG